MYFCTKNRDGKPSILYQGDGSMPFLLTLSNGALGAPGGRKNNCTLRVECISPFDTKKILEQTNARTAWMMFQYITDTARGGKEISGGIETVAGSVPWMEREIINAYKILTTADI
jgi:hypothetical protein